MRKLYKIKKIQYRTHKMKTIKKFKRKKLKLVKRREEIKLYAQRRKRPGCDESNKQCEERGEG